MMAERGEKSPAKVPEDKASAGEEKTSVARWIIGWIVLPAGVVGAIFSSGVLVGAHFADSWFTRLVVWIAQ